MDGLGIAGWHAHIYYDPATRAVAARLREGLTVLVHPETGRQRADHEQHALWMGAVLPLDASVLPD